MDQFRYVSHPQEVIFSSGALARLGEAVERAGWKRLLLCASRSMKANGSVERVRVALGERLVGVFDAVNPHVQDVQVDQGIALADRQEIDSVLGLGGGSPIGMAKAIGFQSALPIIAIPTTYAGSEMTAVYGVTHTRDQPPRKVTVTDPKIAPRLVIYDPELTLDLPSEMTASTGINAVAHCVEALYSNTRHPVSTAVAVSGIRHINHALLRCCRDGSSLEARTEMLIGAHLAGLSLASASMGLHHGLCHVLGGTANVPHGIANSIMLPHAIRFNALATATQLLPAVEAMGISANGRSAVTAVEALAQEIFELVGRLNLPQRLRDASVSLKESDLPYLAQLAFQNRTVQNNPKPITEPAQIETLLRNAW
jgi:maleylacetate reductase